MEVITATTEHAKAVAVLFDAYRVYYDQAPDLSGAEEFIGERLSRRESVIFVAMEEGEAVGFVQLYPIFTSVGMGKAWLLNDLYVLPDRRSNGIGKALLKAARGLAQETGAKWVMLQTYVTNTGAQALYERSGYVKDEQSFYYYLSI